MSNDRFNSLWIVDPITSLHRYHGFRGSLHSHQPQPIHSSTQVNQHAYTHSCFHSSGSSLPNTRTQTNNHKQQQQPHQHHRRRHQLLNYIHSSHLYTDLETSGTNNRTLTHIILKCSIVRHVKPIYFILASDQANLTVHYEPSFHLVNYSLINLDHFCMSVVIGTLIILFITCL